MDTYQVKENDAIDVIAVAWKGNRKLIMKQSLSVIDGDPPDIRIE